MRSLFTDGWNSLWHASFGIMAVQYNIIIPIFLVYQCLLKPDANTLVDVAEFAVGFMVMYLCSKATVKNEQRD